MQRIVAISVRQWFQNLHVFLVSECGGVHVGGQLGHLMIAISMRCWMDRHYGRATMDHEMFRLRFAVL